MMPRLTEPRWQPTDIDPPIHRDMERVRRFDEAVRALAWKHGFIPGTFEMTHNRHEWDMRIVLGFTMDHRIPPIDRPEAT